MTAAEGFKIGVAGCGAMGLPMAKALLADGFDVCGFDVRPIGEFGDFSKKMIVEPHDFSARCDVVICVVRDRKQVLELCFDEQSLFSADNPPTTFVLSSTVSPRFVHELRARLPDGVVLIDAPMSGAPVSAQEASLTFMIGGPEKDVESLRPAFMAMGRKIHWLGKSGAGMTAKVLNNFVAASCVVTVRNVLHHAATLGMDRDALLKVMGQSSGQTWFGSNFDRIDWAGENHDPANTIGILEKDVKAFIDALEDGPEPLHEAIIAALQELPPVPEAE